MKKLTPLGDRLLVEKLQPKKQTVGGIVLPESAQIKQNYATVIEVGSGRRGDDGKITPLTIKKGDTILLSDWSGNTVKVNDKELLMIREDEVLGVVEFDQ